MSYLKWCEQQTNTRVYDLLVTSVVQAVLVVILKSFWISPLQTKLTRHSTTSVKFHHVTVYTLCYSMIHLVFTHVIVMYNFGKSYLYLVG